MNPELMALLQALIGQGSSPQNAPQSAGFASSPDTSGFIPQMHFSPVNANQNYAGTVSRFFESNPMGGGNRFQFNAPVQPGIAGNRATRGHDGYWSSIGTQDHNATMQSVLRALQS